MTAKTLDIVKSEKDKGATNLPLYSFVVDRTTTNSGKYEIPLSEQQAHLAIKSVIQTISNDSRLERLHEIIGTLDSISGQEFLDWWLAHDKGGLIYTKNGEFEEVSFLNSCEGIHNSFGQRIDKVKRELVKLYHDYNPELRTKNELQTPQPAWHKFLVPTENETQSIQPAWSKWLAPAAAAVVGFLVGRFSEKSSESPAPAPIEQKAEAEPQKTTSGIINYRADWAEKALARRANGTANHLCIS